MLNIDAATIPDLQRQMTDGRLTATDLAHIYLDRIREVDVLLNALIAANPAALHDAADADLRRRDKVSRGPLDGIPILIKDNVDTAGLATSAGSRALVDTCPPTDAVLVQRLRAAGAVILGKTNLSEWDNFRSWHGTSGWSGVNGQTNNPHVLDRNPCGSSSGCAAAVAASLAQVSIATETDGSLVCPAGINGVVGLKPTLGLIPRTGMMVISADQDTAGPMARHVIDVALALAAIQGSDAADIGTADYPDDQPVDYAGLLDADSLRGKRVGVWRLSGCVAEVDRVVSETERVLRLRGAAVMDVELPFRDEIGAHKIPALMAEFRRDLESYLRGRPGAPDTLAGLVEFNHSDEVELTHFGQEIFEHVLAAPTVEHPDYGRWRETATALARRSIDDTMAEYELDAIIAPTNSPAWKTDYPNGDSLPISSASPAAVAGYPSISVPAGYSGPLPIGISFFAGRWADAEVLSMAYAFEQATSARRPPRYLQTM